MKKNKHYEQTLFPLQSRHALPGRGAARAEAEGIAVIDALAGVAAATPDP